MILKIPDLSLVLLIGASGSGKSSFAKKHFKATEVISSDYCRALISDDENNQSVSKEAFELLEFIASKRLALGNLAVIDATNVQPEARKFLLQLAQKHHVLPVAIVFDLSERVCIERNKKRDDRNFGSHIIRKQKSELNRSKKRLKQEGFRYIYYLNSEEEVDNVAIERIPLWNDKTGMNGPFDIIGDIHGCYDELLQLLHELGYQTVKAKEGVMGGPVYAHPLGRKAIFLGDFVDRGPKIVECIRLIYNMVQCENALCVPGNHDVKLLRALNGKNVQVTHGLAESLSQIHSLPSEIMASFKINTLEFLNGLVSHYVLDDRKLVVAHAGLKSEMQGRASGRVREFCLYGETTGETDEFGLPVRYNWAEAYRGQALVVYGHTPVPEPEWLNRTINIDTGCVFGGKLTAFRYPEKELVSVPAKHIYCNPVKPFPVQGKDRLLDTQQEYDDLLDAADVIGKRIISTPLKSGITIQEEHACAALEVMSRFAVNPKWIIYLPPTMSPTETSGKDGYLEYPDEAFQYFRSNGVNRVICEEKHMGSRAIVVICKNEETVLKCFGIKDEGLGKIYTRTGRAFFNNLEIEHEFINEIKQALDDSGFWKELETNWVCMDCELMPWSEKAKELIKYQYAAVGKSACVSISQALSALMKTSERNDLEQGLEIPQGSSVKEFDVKKLNERYASKLEMIQNYIEAYRRYCWPVETLSDYKLAPFHILATEGKVHIDKDHEWHMQKIDSICRANRDILLLTPYRIIDVTNEASLRMGCTWWEQLTEGGGEGMVVKPLNFIGKGKRGLLQPALKCRGKEYLRIIYGPEYTFHDNLEKLKVRGLGKKRSLALKEFALGIEALERFVRREPLRRIHECVFGVLAMESEPVDPRL